jgi:hypothetical protein
MPVSRTRQAATTEAVGDCGIRPTHERSLAMSATSMAAIVLILAVTQPALAADSGGNKAQTTRMSQCSAEAKEKGLKGDARKEHMSQCLRNPGAQAAAKECNGAAAEKGLKGERRKAFVDECVKAKGSGGGVG